MQTTFRLTDLPALLHTRRVAWMVFDLLETMAPTEEAEWMQERALDVVADTSEEIKRRKGLVALLTPVGFG